MSKGSDRIEGRYNTHSPSVQRILKEIKEIHRNPSSLFTAQPLEDNIFEWHFTLRGPRGTDFEGGVYHGKILLPDDYPFKPPDIIFLTKNGRFEVGKKICLTISSHHAETWQPSWSIRTAVLAIIAFMPTRGDGAIASLDWPPSERRKAAQQSLAFRCEQCGVHNMTALPPEDESEVLPEAPKELAIKNKEEQERDEKEKAARASSAQAVTSSPSTSSSHSTSTNGADGGGNDSYPSTSSARAEAPNLGTPALEVPQLTQRQQPPPANAPNALNTTPIAHTNNVNNTNPLDDTDFLSMAAASASNGRSGFGQYLDVFMSAIIVVIVALVLRRFFWI